MEPAPIEVNATPTPAQIAALLRQIVTVLGSIAGALGYAGVFDDRLNLATSMIGPTSALIAIVWGQIATRATAQKLAVAADAAPDRVAVLKT